MLKIIGRVIRNKKLTNKKTFNRPEHYAENRMFAVGRRDGR